MICTKNEELASNGKPIITSFEGLTEVGTQFNPSMITKLIELKMEALVQTMSGEGENQGKTFYTASYLTEHGIEKWEIEDIPTNLKDFVDSNISVSKQAMKEILAGLGMDPAITNVSNEGIFNSGSQVYYAYLLYLETQHYAEEIILQELTRAIQLNFPNTKLNNVVPGFKRFAPPRQQETSPTERIENKQ